MKSVSEGSPNNVATGAATALLRAGSDCTCPQRGRRLFVQFAVATAMLLFGSVANAQFCAENFDGVTAPALPQEWISYRLSGTASLWKSTTINPDTAPNAAFAADPASVADNVLASPLAIVTAANSMFHFRHSYNTEANLDGGVLEISINDGGFVDIVSAGGSFSLNGYDSTISSAFMSPIAGRMAWSGNSGGFITTGVVLPPAAMGNLAQLRWRAASDSSVGGTGWLVDTIVCGAPPSYWSHDAPYPIAIAGQAMATVGNVLYSFGGVSAALETASAYKFDSHAWTAIAALPVAAGYASVASDGQYAYIMGGANTSGTVFSSAYRYNPVADTYTNFSPAPTARWNSAAVYLNGKIYKIGGSTSTTSSSATTAVEVYDIATNSWANAAPYPVAISFASAFARGSFVYVAGGSNVAKAYRYDPATNLWDDAAIADLPQARQAAAAANFHSTAILAGGYLNTSQTATTSVVQWNPQTNIWETIPHMIAPRARGAGGIVNGCFFAVGGVQSGNSFSVQTQTLDCLFYNGFEP